MKRKILLIVVAVVIVALMGVLAACNKKDTTPAVVNEPVDSFELTSAKLGTANFNVEPNYAFDVVSEANLTSSGLLAATVKITSNLASVPALKATAKGDNVYSISAVGGFAEYASYKVELENATFVEDPDADHIIFKIAGANKEVVKLSDEIIALSNGQYDEEAEELTLAGNVNYAAGDVFELGGKYYKATNVVKNGSSTTIQVETPAAAEVFDELDVHVSNQTVDLSGIDLELDEQALELEIQNSEYVQNVISLLSKRFDVVDNAKIKVSIDVTFEDGNLLLGIYITIKIDKIGDINIAIDNAYKVTYSADYSLKPITFDLDAKLRGTTEVGVSFSKDFALSYDKDLVDFSKQLANCKGKLLDTLSTKICKLEAPIGTTPLLFFYQLSFDTSVGVYGHVSAGVGFDVAVDVGLAYIDKDIEKYAKFDGKVSDVNVKLFGKVNANANLSNQIGISLANLADASVGVGVGVYGDVAGGLDAGILSKTLSAGYYVEVGLYIPITAKVKVVGLIDKTFTLKEWKIPFYEAGCQYIPNEIADNAKKDYVIVDKQIAIENVKAASAINLMAEVTDHWVANVDIAPKFFNYEYDANYITIEDGAIKLAANAPAYFSELYGNAQTVTATSKFNKQCKYTFTVSKYPTIPTTLNATAEYDKKDAAGLTYSIYLNGTTFEEVRGVDQAGYVAEINDNVLSLTFKQAYLAGLNVGANSLIVVCSKNGADCELRLTANVIDTTPATIDGDATADFVMGSSTSALFKFNLFGSKFLGITDADGELDATDYSFSNYTGNLKIFQNYFDGKAIGAYSFKVATTYADLDVTVTLVDNRAPVIATSDYVYNKVWATDLSVAITLYSATIESVKANGIAIDGYTVNDKGIVLAADYIANLGDYTPFVVVTDKGNVSFNLRIDSTAAFLVLAKTCTVDLNNLSDANYYFISNSGDKASLNINASNYAIVGDGCSYVVTIKSDYISGLIPGSYDYTLNCGDNNAIFNLTVIDTTVSTIGADAFPFDKNAPKNVEISVALSSSDAIDAVIGYGIEKSDYSKLNGKVAINSSYLAELNCGTYTFEISTKNGAVLEATISVTDSRTPTATNIADYSKAIGGNAFFVITLYGQSFLGIENLVEGSDYLVSTNGDTVTITLQAAYLAKLEVGHYTIKALTSSAEVEKELNIIK